MQRLKFNPTMFIDNVLGICPECKEEAFLVAIVQDYYRCTNCGEDTRQFVNGVIKYMKINETDKEFIKRHGTKSSSR
jgi:DNA-directed RNA polymerase subunit RPC12/RpoP